MKIGFDLGGSLSEHEWLRRMAGYIYHWTDHEVHIITLIEDGEQQVTIDRLKDLKVTYNDIHFCIANGMPMTERAQLKVGVMKRHRIEILFDDVEKIVNVINENGMVGILV